MSFFGFIFSIGTLAFSSFFERQKGDIPSLFDILCICQSNVAISQPMAKIFKEYCSLHKIK